MNILWYFIISIYFQSFVDSEMVQVVEIPTRANQGSNVVNIAAADVLTTQGAMSSSAYDIDLVFRE